MTFRDVYGIISARGNAKIGKNPCTFVFMGAVKKYKYRNKQISLTDFNTPVGMKLNPDNRWVKKAELIPWDEIEQRYAKLFTNRIKTDSLSKQLKTKLETVKKLYEQQKYMYDNHTHSVPDRIISISQPWLRPIVMPTE